MSQRQSQSLIAASEDVASKQRLKAVYQSDLIAPEKKPFLADLQASSGPFLAVESGGLICDAASQIASLGLGFNAGALFGTAHFLESWTGRTDTASMIGVRHAFTELLRRKLGSNEFSAHFTASGAETVETALGFCWENRTPDQISGNASKVLAFEGSFHGRMMVALACTWNPVKREPFAWPGFESRFAPYPEMDDADIQSPVIPTGWRAFWSEVDQVTPTAAQAFAGDDPLLAKEVNSLLAVHKTLAAGEVFAVIIEPRQCEGGDRFASSRFHNGLINLCRAHAVPLIYDEVQTGFALGGEFFWHRLFDLRDAAGNQLYPDHVVCAKKAQTGVLLSRRAAPAITAHETANAPSLVRGYIQASVLDQFRPQIELLERVSLEHLERLAAKYDFLTRPRGKGLSLAFDLDSPERIAQLLGSRFNHGLLFYQAGSLTVRFRMNLGYREPDIQLFWQQLDAALAGAGDGAASDASAATPSYRDPQPYYAAHRQLVLNKLPSASELSADPQQVTDFVRQQLPAELQDAHVVTLDATSYSDFRSRILELQSVVYEPARQSTPEEFDRLFQAERPLALLVLASDAPDAAIVAMAFAGPLSLFDMRGRDQDPFRDDPSVYYMLDLTVAEANRGGLGRVMKQGLLRLAQQSGVSAIHGRNRDRLAGEMWAINLSLGSFQTQHLVDDYPDSQPHRDCLYYRSPTRWPAPPICLSAGITAPLGADEIDAGFVEANLPSLVNKITLSNFVTRQYLDHLQDVSKLWPERLRHLYTASGQSECVDKIVKVLWSHRSPRTKLIAIGDGFFGGGSFMARALSNVGTPYFDVLRFDTPSESAIPQFLDDLRKSLDDALGVFVEPVLQRTMQRMSPQLLREISSVCNEAGVPWVCNDTAGLHYRFDSDQFAPSGVPGVNPDFFMAFLGGQMGLVGCTSEMFLSKPLLLISTWDGDAFSLAQFHHAASRVAANPTQHAELQQSYHDALKARLEQSKVDVSKIDSGVGCFSGNVSKDLAAMFRQNENGQYVSCPSPSAMLRFLDWDQQ